MTIKTTSPLTFGKTVDTRKSMIIWLSSAFLSKFKTWQKTFRKSRIDRAAIKSLLKLSDKELRDIGISRADIFWASRLHEIKTLRLNYKKLREKTVIKRAKNYETFKHTEI